MKTEEKQLFKNLCNLKAEHFDAELLKFATPAVLGHLFFNRMQVIAYGVLRDQGLLGKVNREFRNSLRSAYEQNVEKNNSFYWCVQYLDDVLSKCNCKYAMLKGAYLCHYYPKGYRTSSDIDLLVRPEDVTQIGNALTIAGFRQGNIRNEEFIPATRKEVIESKMLRGETVPYIKELNFPNMRYLEVDINFSLDYKNSVSTALDMMLEKASKREVRGAEVMTLDDSDFFIHLCAHLYKEATTLPWVEMMRDMTLYKYSDIYLLVEEMSISRLEKIFERAMALGMEKECAFAVIQTGELFDISNRLVVEKAMAVLKNDPDYIHRVISPKDNKTFVFTEKNIFERLFADSRKDLLQEEI